MKHPANTFTLSPLSTRWRERGSHSRAKWSWIEKVTVGGIAQGYAGEGIHPSGDWPPRMDEATEGDNVVGTSGHIRILGNLLRHF